MGNIEFRDYNKMTDVIYYAGHQLYLKINVTLSYLTTDRKKTHFHKEIENNEGVKIQRNFSYYLTIEKQGDDYTSVMVRPQDMIYLLDKFKEVSEWFRNPSIKLFMWKKKKLICLKGVVESAVISGLANNKYITIEPIVYQFDEASPQSPGVRITLGGPTFVDMDVDSFFGLYYSIQNVNMFQCAQNMVNYLGRPEFGTNLMNMSRPGGNSMYEIPQESGITGGVRRTIGSNKTKSMLE